MARHLLPEAQGEITWAEWLGGKSGEEEVLGGVCVLGSEDLGTMRGRMPWAMCCVSGPFSSTSRLREGGGGVSQGGACGAGGRERAAMLRGGTLTLGLCHKSPCSRLRPQPPLKGRGDR